MTLLEPGGQAGQMAQFKKEGGGKISNLAERKEAHLKDLSLQQFQKHYASAT